MEELKKKIEEYAKKLQEIDQKAFQDIGKEQIAAPFSVEGQQLVYLLNKHVLSYEEYQKLKEDFSIRNKYSYFYDMTSATFGKQIEKLIMKIQPDFKPATTSILREYGFDPKDKCDLLLNDLNKVIKIEVKACRASDAKGGDTLASRAYSYEKSKGFAFHFQQLKPSKCDVFIWVAVCIDKLLFFVLNEKELKTLEELTTQHGDGTDDVNDSAFEGQIFLTEDKLNEYGFAVSENDLVAAVKQKYEELQIA